MANIDIESWKETRKLWKDIVLLLKIYFLKINLVDV